MSGCSRPWCTTPHSHGRGHTAHFGIASGVTFILLEGEAAGSTAEPVVRLFYPVDGSDRALDLAPQLACDLRDLLTAIPADQMTSFAAALYAAGATLGGAA